MKALIIDDERLARQELRLLLSRHPQVAIVGEADTVESAVAATRELQPDVLFLDVQLRGGTGFEVLERLIEPKPLVVFCTAYQEHAATAFDTEAVDYLLKPVAPERLARTLEKLETALEPSGESNADGTPGMLDGDSLVLLREGDRHQLVPASAIRCVVSEGNYCRVHLNGQAQAAFLIYRSLQSLEQRLPTSLFFRASRSHLVNVTCIESIEPWFSQSLKARLTGGQEVEFSRRAALAFRERFTL